MLPMCVTEESTAISQVNQRMRAPTACEQQVGMVALVKTRLVAKLLPPPCRRCRCYARVAKHPWLTMLRLSHTLRRSLAYACMLRS